MADIAAHLRLSRSYFCTLFKKYSGISPNLFINKCRISKVLRLLEASDMNVLGAAMASGFSSASGFYKTFSTVCGMSPREYLNGR